MNEWKYVEEFRLDNLTLKRYKCSCGTILNINLRCYKNDKLIKYNENDLEILIKQDKKLIAHENTQKHGKYLNNKNK